MNESLNLVREFKAFRDTDGFFKDGLEALAIAIRHIQSRDDIHECFIDLPGKLSVIVDFNGGAPTYLVKENEALDNFKETTRTGAVEYLEGNL
ncbi:hypothetical protein RE428_48980 (plasmid) [Marinobacter nanhaiticus D15-8W]|uniref:Uncharacterized protein n=1 Tax=Marinobacter nanhaiticus D15-8W TaxID=626887 RepID=N6X151_9GAMM|nr:hypothetical protein [Marinobacter nanhaiticus]ENO17152.1 hypothetical protein J057_00764 [Marinobacter nanhaiticus D15-8W]BES73880.1 hypothetical protein RE428_48980 [Marinobacter nanhaiticus D15-8W]